MVLPFGLISTHEDRTIQFIPRVLSIIADGGQDGFMRLSLLMAGWPWLHPISHLVWIAP